MFHLRACDEPQTETFAPVSDNGESIQLFMTTGARKSHDKLDFSLGKTLFLDDFTKKTLILYVFSSEFVVDC